MHRLLTIAALVLSLGISSAEAAKRLALVIGNDSYKNLLDLNNARTDARSMATKLKELGWSVILKQDASRHDISRSMADFEGRLKDAEVDWFSMPGMAFKRTALTTSWLQTRE